MRKVARAKRKICNPVPSPARRRAIARVAWLPALDPVSEYEMARRCCRRPTCQRAILPPGGCRALRSQPSLPGAVAFTSICCRPDAFLRRRCSTLAIVILCCGRAALPPCADPWLPRRVHHCSSRSGALHRSSRTPVASHTLTAVHVPHYTYHGWFDGCFVLCYHLKYL